jgi:MFS family permease
MDRPAQSGFDVSRARAGYVLFILFLISMLNYYDRYLIGILVEDLKRDLSLTDGQIGLLSGLAFAVVYSIASLPIAAYADRGFRVRVLGSALTIWSAMTGLCGMATGFWTMLLARFGVGVGEAGGAPTTHAIVAETFGDKYRGTALSAMGVAGAIGTTIAFAGGGYIAQHYGWRWAFFGAAIPGLILAVIFLLTVREPRRVVTSPGTGSTPILQALGVLLRRPAYRWMCVAVAGSSIAGYGSTAFMPAYLMRHFNLDSATAGAAFAAAMGPATIVATLAGGAINDWLGRRSARAPFWFLALSFALALPLTIASLTVDDFSLVMMLVWPSTLIGALWIGPSYAIIQALSGPKFRAMGAAFFMLCVNLLGQSLGPVLVGGLSDYFGGEGGLGLRYALIISSCTMIIAVVGFLMAARTAPADAEAAARY